MLKEALEYFRGLEDVVFLIEYNDGEPYDTWKSVQREAYLSIDTLMEIEAIKGRIPTVVKNQGYPGNELKKGEEYTLTFETDRNPPRVQRIEKRLTKMDEEMDGEGEEAFNLLPEREKQKKYDKYSELQMELQEITNDYSSWKVIVAWLK